MKVLNSSQSKELEKKAVEAGTDYLQLMENAGTSAVRFLQKKFSLDQKHVIVLCGKGNNGGDGYVAARQLSELGALVVVLLVQGPPVTDISKDRFACLNGTMVKVISGDEHPEMINAMLLSADFIIDAIFGTGFHGAVPQNLLYTFSNVKRSSATMISLDMPSGANCDTGAVDGECIEADYTISFSTLKNGHLIQPAQSFCGQVVVVPIGIETKLINRQESTLEVTELNEVRAMLKPRKPESNKGDYGKLLCLCGSEGMAGAAIMSAKAAIRCGAGIVQVALPRSIYPIVASQVVEPIFTLLDDYQSSSYMVENQSALSAALSSASACLIGCGLGKNQITSSLVFYMISHSKVPLIIDADGINMIAENINILEAVEVPIVLTPHPGEMARLCNTTVQDIQAHRLEYARSFAKKHHVILVLKGSGTIIAEPNGMTHLNLTGNAGMAKGGSGDVLAGMIASFIAQKVEPTKAAAGAVYLHGAAGDRCAKVFSKCAMLPTDMVDMLPKLFLEIEQSYKAG
jgi:ADP-dependent NAD(P)H-hydrate dehydratase / NAD(P)H-hydrate epimerase